MAEYNRGGDEDPEIKPCAICNGHGYVDSDDPATILAHFVTGLTNFYFAKRGDKLDELMQVAWDYLSTATFTDEPADWDCDGY
jgi:hypothetical protein